MRDRIVINDVLVEYYKFQQNGDKTLLFLHGWRSNSLVWKKTAEALVDSKISIYALDLPGFGASDTPKTPFNLQDYADIVTGFIQKKGLKKIILVGHSFGGRVAIKLAGETPKHIEKLVLVDSAGFKASSKRTAVYKLIAKLVKPAFKPKLMQKAKAKIYGQIGAEDYVATPQLKQTYLNIINEDLTSNLSKIKTPTLLIWGEDDRDTPLEFGSTMHEKIKGSRLEILPQAGHFSFLDQQANFCLLLEKFINQ